MKVSDVISLPNLDYGFSMVGPPHLNWDSAVCRLKMTWILSNFAAHVVMLPSCTTFCRWRNLFEIFLSRTRSVWNWRSPSARTQRCQVRNFVQIDSWTEKCRNQWRQFCGKGQRGWQEYSTTARDVDTVIHSGWMMQILRRAISQQLTHLHNLSVEHSVETLNQDSPNLPVHQIIFQHFSLITFPFFESVINACHVMQSFQEYFLVTYCDRRERKPSNILQTRIIQTSDFWNSQHVLLWSLNKLTLQRASPRSEQSKQPRTCLPQAAIGSWDCRRRSEPWRDIRGPQQMRHLVLCTVRELLNPSRVCAAPWGWPIALQVSRQQRFGVFSLRTSKLNIHPSVSLDSNCNSRKLLLPPSHHESSHPLLRPSLSLLSPSSSSSTCTESSHLAARERLPTSLQINDVLEVRRYHVLFVLRATISQSALLPPSPPHPFVPPPFCPPPFCPPPLPSVLPPLPPSHPLCTPPSPPVAPLPFAPLFPSLCLRFAPSPHLLTPFSPFSPLLSPSLSPSLPFPLLPSLSFSPLLPPLSPSPFAFSFPSPFPLPAVSCGWEIAWRTCSKSSCGDVGNVSSNSFVDSSKAVNLDNSRCWFPTCSWESTKSGHRLSEDNSWHSVIRWSLCCNWTLNTYSSSSATWSVKNVLLQCITFFHSSLRTVSLILKFGGPPIFLNFLLSVKLVAQVAVALPTNAVSVFVELLFHFHCHCSWSILHLCFITILDRLNFWWHCDFTHLDRILHSVIDGFSCSSLMFSDCRPEFLTSVKRAIRCPSSSAWVYYCSASAVILFLKFECLRFQSWCVVLIPSLSSS